ncbi:putative fels-2 prophage Pin [Enterobacter roggenkampii]|uniref:gp53-like domain-containing protein n=1 Tax=Enterobacter roggenkampii TaxID=1812935 RepID=UPI000D498E67|nr:phage tail protein [Enterobacter roggenkampii]PRW43664.1 putative fels-2 prophage Pin [Enterobacter roggenkampii]
MATNNFKAFALDPNANVTSQADWEALPALLSGFTAGKASSAQVNKAIRQASFIAAALAQYTADKSGEDVLDDGDISGFIAKMSAAFGEDFQPKNEKLTAFSGLSGAANRLPYFTGANALALTALTAAGRNLIGQADVPAILEYLGFGDRLLEANGYFKLPGGFLLQWGSGSVQASNATVRFKKPFNVTPFIVLPHKITADNRYVTSVNYTLTGFSLYGWNGGGVEANIDSYTYLALGM